MPDFGDPLFDAGRRTNWVRLRTLIVLRWIAASGQLAAIVAAVEWFGVHLAVGPAIAVVAALIVSNLVAMSTYPDTTRLSERAAAAMLLFDIAQLGALLAVTGGLSNPFALLILAPVTISATALRAGTTVILGTVAITIVTLLSQWSVPMRDPNGIAMTLPDDFRFGFWSAIVIGVGFLSVYAQRVSAEVHEMAQALVATQMALAREQKLTDLGGVVAAAAHELGTPLATIKLTAAELADDLPKGSDAAADARLIAEQTDRCRDILRSMGRAGKDDMHFRMVPFSTLVTEAARPHEDRGKRLVWDIRGVGEGDMTEPTVSRRPEVIHGLRNLIQNAVDFASTTVWIDLRWSADHLRVRIVDDGPGFSSTLIGRIGDPFVSLRSAGSSASRRPQYDGMGLGLFIAKTLLERSGAGLGFANGREPFEERARPGTRTGAVVDCLWPSARLALDPDVARGPLPENPHVDDTWPAKAPRRADA